MKEFDYLFKKFQKPLLDLANHRYGRQFLGIRTDINQNLKIVSLLSNAALFYKNNVRKIDGFYRPVIEGHFYCGREVFAEKLWFGLQCLDILSSIPKYAKNKYQDLTSLLYYLFRKDNLNFNEFKYPFLFFTTGDFNCGTGFGFAGINFDTWANVHNATDAAYAYVNAGGYIAVSASSDTYLIRRFWCPANTSGIGAGSSIDSGTLDLWIFSEIVDDNIGSYRYSALVGPTTQADPSTLTTADYDTCGATHSPNVWSDNLNLSSMTLDQYNSWTLNTAGKAGISKTGTSLFGLRMGFDIVDSKPVAEGHQRFYFYGPTDSGKEPHFTITYTPAVSTGASLLDFI